jgi:DNA-binding NarL/FixJ family response regulator
MNAASLENQSGHNISENKQSIRIVIADDHPLIRNGISAVLNSEPNFVIVGEAGSAEEALTLAERHQPDILLLDIGLPERSGIEVLVSVKEKCKDTKVIILTMQESELLARQSLLAGARAFLLKDLSTQYLLPAMRQVLSGAVIVPEQFAHLVSELDEALKNPTAKKVIKAAQEPLHQLSKREREIFFMLAKGVPNRDIAKDLFISSRTVETHRARILKKLSLGSTPEITRFAIKHGLMKA